MINEIVKLPACVREFMAELSTYIKSDLEVDKYLKTSDPLSVKDGKARINLKIDVVTSPANYNRFIIDFEAAKQKWRVLSSYTCLVFHADPMPTEEIPEQYRERINYRSGGIHIEISLKELLLDKLTYFFNPESDLGVSDSIDILRKCGMSDLVIMNTLNIPRTTYRRYCKNTETKVDTPKSNQKKELTVLPN